MTATALYFHHRDALEYDFRARFGFGVERIDRQELSWRQMCALVSGLFDDHSSHTYASVMGWSYVPTPAEVQFYDELDVKLAMNRQKNQPVPQRAKRPWEEPKVGGIAPVSEESRVRRSRIAEMYGLS